LELGGGGRKTDQNRKVEEGGRTLINAMRGRIVLGGPEKEGGQPKDSNPKKKKNGDGGLSRKQDVLSL